MANQAEQVLLLMVLSWTFVNCLRGVESVTFTLKNNCPYTIWPATQANSDKPQLSTTGLELAGGSSFSLDVPPSWGGRFWARSLCDGSSGAFRCVTGDCASGQVACNGAGGNSPASLAEFTLGGDQGKDFYDVSLVDGFNLPISVAPQGGTGCPATSCAADVNAGCPGQLAVTNPSGSGNVGCNSACAAFSQPQYCCTGAYSTPQTCPPSDFSKYFKSLCPQAYSYAYDDPSSTFTCPTGQAYLITFCP